MSSRSWFNNSRFSRYTVQTLMADPAPNQFKEQARASHACDEGAIATRLRQFSRFCRSHVSPEQIGKEVVRQLTDVLQLDQAILYPYEAGDSSLSSLVAQCAPGRVPIFPEQLNLRARTNLQQVLDTVTSLTFEETSLVPPDVVGEKPPAWNVLAMPISHLGNPYGLLLLVRRSLEAASAHQVWSTLEQDFAEDMAAQLGMAIAQIVLQDQNQALIQKLNQVRDGFIQKHQQLEEARAQAQLAYEEAEEASRLKSEFLANTSHELRTPLNGMIGFLKLVLDGMADTPEELEEFVAEAHSSALLLLDIINDILDVAKIEAGKMELDLTAIQLSELFEEVERKTRLQATNRGLFYDIERPPTHDEVVVYGDYQRLLQVMLNLVGNAIKFTKYGSVTISTRIIQKPVVIGQQKLPGFVEVRVVDTGIGVSLEQQAKLFKSFSQVDGSRTRQYGGTGLGLVISQKLVEAMAGEVHFYSMGEDLGSTVTFTIPLYQKPVMMAVSEEAS